MINKVATGTNFSQKLHKIIQYIVCFMIFFTFLFYFLMMYQQIASANHDYMDFGISI